VRVVRSLDAVWLEDQMVSHPDGIETICLGALGAYQALFDRRMLTEMGQQ